MNPQALRKWREDNAEYTLRLNYPLTSESVVFDLGGYKGDWSDLIFEKYGCFIYIFEPIPSFFERIQDRFKSNSKIKVFNFGISNSTRMEMFCQNKDASSQHLKKGKLLEVELKSFSEFIRDNKIEYVDLLKINIEGEEFPLLEGLIGEGLVSKFGDIQVQFHEFIPNSHELRDKLRLKLKETHELTYDYDFVWENWRLCK